MSEQLPQNKNEQNDNSAFSPDLYQDFDAEAGAQADLAAFNARLDAIKTEHDNRHDDSFNPAASAAHKIHYIPKVDILTKEQLLALPRAKDKFGITAQGSSEDSSSEPAKQKDTTPKEGESLEDYIKRTVKPVAEPKAKEKTTTATSNETAEEPSQAADQSQEEASTTKKTIRSRLGIDEETRARKRNTRDAARRHRNGEDRPESTTQTPLIEELQARPLGGRSAAPAPSAAATPKAEKPAEPDATQTQEIPAVNPDDLPGGLPEAPRTRRRRGGRGRHTEAAVRAAQAAAAAAANASSAPEVGETRIDVPRIPAETTEHSTGHTAPPEANVAEPVTPMTDKERRDESDRRMTEPGRQPGQPHSDATGDWLRLAGPTPPVTPVIRGTTEPAPATPNTTYPEGYDYSSDPDYSHLYRPYDDDDFDLFGLRPRTAQTPEAPEPAPFGPGSHERMAVDDMAARLKQNKNIIVTYEDLPEGTVLLASNTKTDESAQINLNSLDDPESFEDAMNALNSMAENAMTRRQKAARLIGSAVKQVVANEWAEKKMEKIQDRWDDRRPVIESGENVWHDMTAEADAWHGDSTRLDARIAENRRSREERREGRRQRREARRQRDSQEAQTPENSTGSPLGLSDAEADYLTQQGILSEPTAEGAREVVNPQTFSDYMIARMAANESGTPRFANAAEANDARHDNYMRLRSRMGQRRFAAGAALGLAAFAGLTGATKLSVENMMDDSSAPSVSASPTPGETQSPSSTPTESASPSASASESTKPSASSSPSTTAPEATPSSTPSSPATVNPNRPDAPEPGQGGNGSTGGNTGPRTETHDGEVLTFSADGKTVTAKLRPGGSILGAAQDANIDPTAAANAVAAAGITDQQARNLQPGQIVDFTQNGNNSYTVKLQ